MLNYKKIAKKVEDGSYYSLALSWYNKKYLVSVVQRSWLFIIFIITFFTFLYLLVNLITVSSQQEKPAIVTYVENQTDYFSHIKSLTMNDESAQEAIAQYLLTYYIKSREEYNPGDMQDESYRNTLRIMKSFSTKEVLNEYTRYMSKRNRYSPYIRYRDHTQRSVRILSIKFVNKTVDSGKANILFEATETNLKDGSIEKNTWHTEIHFRMPNIENISYSGERLRFLIKYYRSTLQYKD